MPEQLPSLSKMLLPTLLSMRKGVKIKEEGIHIEKRYTSVYLDKAKLKAFADFLDSSNQRPLSYLYCIAQRAQIAAMLDKEFSIALPGMVHLENILEAKKAWSVEKPFEIEVKLSVAYKAEGSLIPRCEVNFYQEDEKVLSCLSTYMARRKISSSHKKKEKQAVILPKPSHRQAWSISANTGKKYAAVSGDHNPIHTYAFFARLMGFKRAIAHGWYSVARAAVEAEKKRGKDITFIEVAFKSPVFLPSEQHFSFFELGEGLGIALHNSQGKLVLHGKLA